MIRFTSAILFCLVLFSCEKDDPEPESKTHVPCRYTVSYHVPYALSFASPATGTSFYEGDTIHIQANSPGGYFSTTGIKITSLSDTTIYGSTNVGIYDFIVGPEIDSALIVYYGNEINGYPDGRCGGYSMSRSTSLKVKFNH